MEADDLKAATNTAIATRPHSEFTMGLAGVAPADAEIDLPQMDRATAAVEPGRLDVEQKVGDAAPVAAMRFAARRGVGFGLMRAT